MNKEWSEQNKRIQSLIKKADTLEQGKTVLFNLRNDLMNTLLSFREKLKREDFDSMPFMNADGYHCKNIAYSIWHIFRIEDIVAHTLINGDEEVFFSGNYQNRINSPIITTGNELIKEQISNFTKHLNLDELYSYSADVKKSTEDIIRNLTYNNLKNNVTEYRKEKLKSLGVVSSDENAVWLIDYWCNKDVRGLIQMPFSRHWIMHIEACLRIKNKFVLLV
ncbi:MAG: phage head-tail adapter protein [Bacteroidales bacterium]|nr:phage head-tail adapter protein [Bacteroidales bacterium]